MVGWVFKERLIVNDIVYNYVIKKAIIQKFNSNYN